MEQKITKTNRDSQQLKMRSTLVSFCCSHAGAHEADTTKTGLYDLADLRVSVLFALVYNTVKNSSAIIKSLRVE